MKKDLLNSYLHTSYTIYPAAGENLVFKINKTNATLDLFLQQQHAIAFALLTAWNPRSQLLTVAENRRRNQLLRTDVQRYRTFAAAGVPAAGEDWEPETSFFILNITPDEALLLARKYEQNAFVYGSLNEPPRLVET